MKTLYLDCSMGVAGDMLMAGLLELSPDPLDFVHTINCLGISGVSVLAETVSRRGMSGTHIKVIWNGHEEQGYYIQNQKTSHINAKNECGRPIEIESVLTSLPLPSNIKEDALAVMKLIFEAESHVHGVDMIDIHDSRLGTMDAIMDVIGCCILIDQLAPEQIVASPVHVGYGQIRSLRGMLPIPAPATEYLLRDIPYYSDEI